MCKQAISALSIIFFLSVIPAANADSRGKFPGMGSVKAYNQTVDIISEADKLLDAGKFESAINLYRKAIAIYPNDSNSHQSIAIALRKVGKFEESINEDKRAIELESHYLSAWLNMGLDYEALHKYADAERCYRKAVEINPESYGANFDVGDILRQQGKISEARKWLLRAKNSAEGQNDPSEVNKALKLCDQEEKKLDRKESSN